MAFHLSHVMKIKRALQYLLVNDVCWFLLRPVTYIAKRLELSRENFLWRKQEDANEALCKKLFESKTVLNGPFKGMRMGDIRPTGSSIYSKLLGSYESEIMPELAKLLGQKYDYLINVGSDEGYYAVGIARLQAGIKVYAFDCSVAAQERCKSLAVLNNVSDQIATQGCFNERDLHTVTANERSLFIIDCEGCENAILTASLIQSFTSADFIIELHFERDPLIAEKLQAFFAPTHNVGLVRGLSDHERVMQYDFTEISGLDYEQKRYILNERNNFMQWLIATPR